MEFIMAFEALRCPNCGAPLENNQKFCDHCGIGLKSTDPENKEKQRGINISIDGKDKTYNYGISFDSAPNYNTSGQDAPKDQKEGYNYNYNYTYGNVNNKKADNSCCGNKTASSLSKEVALILAVVSLFFVGGIAIHKIYLKKFGDFVLSLIFCWTFIPAIVCLFNVISLATMSKDDFAKKYY